MKAFWLALASLLLSAGARATEPLRLAHAKILVVRSYVSWALPQGEIRYEPVCEREIDVPVFDFREHPERRSEATAAELVCESTYRDGKIPILVRGLIELVPAEVFGLGLPSGTVVKRTFFTLAPDVGEGFSYLPELQPLSGWQLFTEDLSLRSQIFLLSPEAFITIQCETGGCSSTGPQSVYRAQVKLTDSPR